MLPAFRKCILCWVYLKYLSNGSPETERTSRFQRLLCQRYPLSLAPILRTFSNDTGCTSPSLKGNLECIKYSFISLEEQTSPKSLRKMWQLSLIEADKFNFPDVWPTCEIIATLGVNRDVSDMVRNFFYHTDCTMGKSWCREDKTVLLSVHHSPSCYIVSLINIDNWPCLRINNFQQMNQTRSRCRLPRCMILRALQIVIDNDKTQGGLPEQKEWKTCLVFRDLSNEGRSLGWLVLQGPGRNDSCWVHYYTLPNLTPYLHCLVKATLATINISTHITEICLWLKNVGYKFFI